MKHNGLAKLSEESGELLQVAGKLLQYPNLQHDWHSKHPDGTILLVRLEEEMADVLSAIYFTAHKLGLSRSNIDHRGKSKLALYHEWDREEDA